jgi:predicted MPP superfamily phosphohydrolase
MSYRMILILILALLLNGGFAALQIWLLRRRSPWPKSIAVGVCLWNLTMVSLFLVQVFSPLGWHTFLREWFYFPMAVEMIWNALLVEFLFLGSILIVLAVLRLRPVAKAAPLTPDGISRRNFIYSVVCSAPPALALGMGVHGLVTSRDLRVRNVSIPIAGLPPELEGFTIAHVSDLHSGIFVGPDRLKIVSDATNDLKADLVAITGDIINLDMQEFPPALHAIKAIESRHGTYLCEGNHDCIAGDGVVLNACTENNLPMLSNRTVILPIRGHRLILAGLPWMKTGFEGRPEIVSNLFPARQPGDVRVLLAHHPHLFDIAESTDLVLTGHTHGGQVMLTPHFGLGPVFFKYWSGLYQRGQTSMLVSNGCGDWFPCRIGAPAEISLVRLTAAA